jgi:hypothetical protein
VCGGGRVGVEGRGGEERGRTRKTEQRGGDRPRREEVEWALLGLQIVQPALYHQHGAGEEADTERECHLEGVWDGNVVLFGGGWWRMCREQGGPTVLQCVLLGPGVGVDYQLDGDGASQTSFRDSLGQQA